MKVLGISYGHNATVALMDNGVLRFCQSEERLNRLKNSSGFPTRTVDYIYGTFGGPETFDAAVLFEETPYGYLYLKEHNFEAHQTGGYIDTTKHRGWQGWRRRLLKSRLGWDLQHARIRWNEAQYRRTDEVAGYFTRSLRMPAAKVFSIDHHLAHAYSAVPNVLPWGQALIFTLDGVGDWKCGSVNRLDGDRLTVLNVNDHRASPGYFYGVLTSWMGMKAGEHEFKVMGLAPYAKPERYRPLVARLRHHLWIDEQGEWRASVTPYAFADVFDEVFRYQRFDTIAAAVQGLIEELTLEWVQYWIAKTGIQDVALSGGVFMNVKACQRIADAIPGRIFVVPSAADESTPIGAAAWWSMTHGGVRPQPLSHLYLGSALDRAHIEQTLRETNAAARYRITEPPDVDAAAAELLSRNEVVARVRGPMEFGARALGNRSILANPTRLENLQIINQAIKNRDFWMPFTPSILEEDMPRYIQRHDRLFAPYMCITFDATPAAERDLVAAIHPADRTVRPQCVMKAWNPTYHALISHFKSLTGVGGVLNTSFNLHGEPNVCDARDAIHTVDNSGLRYLVLEGFLLEKQ